MIINNFGRIVKFFKDIVKPVSVYIIPHNGMNSMRVNPPMFLLILGGFIWTAITVWAGVVAARHLDYYITKQDNAELRKKMEKISRDIEDGMNYLAMTKKTDKQIRQVLGLRDDPSSGFEEGVGGPSPRDMENFRNQISAHAAEIREAELSEAMKSVTRESKRRLSSFGEITIYLTDRHNSTRATPRGWPAQGRVTSPFGYRVHPLGLTSYRHSGVDIANSAGTPIVATADGVVRYAKWAQGYGFCVLIDHGFGYSTLYGHLSQILVKPGRRVRRGEEVAKMGTTGTSTGSHVHYEVWVGGIPRNPMPYVKNNMSEDSNFSDLYDGIFSVL
ncbi:MAG: M23 family metallopeptidase [Elusimicrobiales bacterium]|nr:M23 family metallopeptidase [Elusimicrobiales bacterium]